MTKQQYIDSLERMRTDSNNRYLHGRGVDSEVYYCIANIFETEILTLKTQIEDN